MLKISGESQPMIEWTIQTALKSGLKPVVILRKQKAELAHYLRHRNEIETIEIESSSEWPDTLLQVQNQWGDINLVLLPDTRFSNPEVIEQLKFSLKKFDSSYGTFKTISPETWGHVSSYGEKLAICEKPKSIPKVFSAWGIFGFKRDAGYQVLKAHLDSTLTHQIINLDLSTELHKIENFKDFARDLQNIEI